MTTPPEAANPHSARALPLTALGWSAQTSQPARSSVELTETSTWVVSRLWSTTGVLQALPRPVGTYRIIIGVDGEASVRVGNENFHIVPRKALIIDGGASILTENSGLWARFEWHLRTAVLQQERFSQYLSKPFEMDDDYYQVIAAMTNTISVVPGFAQSHGSGFMFGALTNIITAALINSVGMSDALSSTQSDLLKKATDLIEGHYSDDTFTASAMTARLMASQASIYRVFAAAGTTPRLAIEARRVASAVSLLASAPVRNANTVKGIAHQSGFTSARQMKEAMKRHKKE